MGLVSRRQLLRCGLSSAGVARWVAAGRLHPLTRGVYAVGFRTLSPERRLAAALLRVGPGSALSHMTAAWWWGLIRFPPERIHVSRCGRSRSDAGTTVHAPKSLRREWHRNLPVATVADTLVDIAPIASEPAIRRAIAKADHLGLVDVGRLGEEVAGRKGCVLRCASDRASRGERPRRRPRGRRPLPSARLVVELDATVADLRSELRNCYAAIRVTHPDEIGGVS